MDILILSRKPELYSTRRLLEEARRAGQKSEVMDPEAQDIQKQRPLRVIPRFGTWRFEQSLQCLQWFERRGSKCLNSSQAFRDARNKWMSYLLFREEGLPVPETKTSRKADLPRVFPYVIKPLEGSKGEGVQLIRGPEDLLSLPPDQEWVVQSFVAEAQGRDLRLLVGREECFAAMERQAKEGDFRSNLAQGGQARRVEPSSFELEIALRAVRLLGLDYGGVDLLRSPEGPLLLEVNACPGLEGIESITGLNVAEKLIQLALKK